MGAAKLSKKQRGKLKKAQKDAAKVPSIGVAVNSVQKAALLAPVSKTHVKFTEDGDAKVTVVGKKRGRQAPASSDAPSKKKAEKDKGQEEVADATGGKSDRSPEMIQSAKYYLEKWKMRNEPTPEGEEPWKFKKVKQLWILKWMFEADVIPKSMFALVLEYLEGMQGVARQRVLEDAHKIIDEGVPEKADEEATEDLASRLTRRRYKRALQIAQVLA
ncbi:hypothetical protein P43SY_007328 [Pythium insidiosum]|uniref:WKF domain-containing protein n=1 Tax=Pythium insidiosum TaxID=114742 RepID=A0AAD5LLQ3_PYTIN|nr:hypothetical protein P43SY_007328 [Pythium insidiosum]